MKKTILVIMASRIALSCFAFTSCEGNTPKESAAVPSEIISSLVSSLAWENTASYTKTDIDALDDEEKEMRLSVLYGSVDGTLPDFAVFEDYAFVTPGGEMTAREIGIFKLSSENNTEEKINDAKAFMQLRVTNVKEIFSGYAPEAVAMAENAVINTWGRYVYYIMADDSAAVEAEIIKALEAKAA